jgi:arabinan endo-1,5-alpha-L-arabinosidase
MTSAPAFSRALSCVLIAAVGITTAAATADSATARSAPTVATLATSASPAASRGTPPTEYRNAVLNHDFPDPDVIKAANGAYYAYSTQSERGDKHVNIQVAKSRDLVHWNYLGDALPELPAWGDDAVVSWAPQVVRRPNRYVLFYSTVPDDLQNSFGLCLAVATSTRPAGPFKATNKPLYCGPTLADIDAYVFRDRVSHVWRMYWGSGGDIVTARLAPNLTHLARPQADPKLLLRGWSAEVHRPYEHGIEGPFVMRRHGWFYLFYSGNRCCSYPPHYATMVARSRHADGPFHRIAETRAGKSSAILHSNDRWAGPGHNSVIRDDAGHDWIIFHAIDRNRPYLPGTTDAVRRPMLISRLLYRNGWPMIAGDSPATGWQPGPVVH